MKKKSFALAVLLILSSLTSQTVSTKDIPSGVQLNLGTLAGIVLATHSIPNWINATKESLAGSRAALIGSAIALLIISKENPEIGQSTISGIIWTMVAKHIFSNKESSLLKKENERFGLRIERLERLERLEKKDN